MQHEERQWPDAGTRDHVNEPEPDFGDKLPPGFPEGFEQMRFRVTPAALRALKELQDREKSSDSEE